MTDRGTYILVEVGEMSVDDLIETIRIQQKPIRICRNGEPVADISLPSEERKPPTDPNLKVIISPSYDPCEGLTEAEWPEHLR